MGLRLLYTVKLKIHSTDQWTDVRDDYALIKFALKREAYQWRSLFLYPNMSIHRAETSMLWSCERLRTYLRSKNVDTLIPSRVHIKIISNTGFLQSLVELESPCRLFLSVCFRRIRYLCSCIHKATSQARLEELVVLLWRWKHQVTSKHKYLSTSLYVVTSQMTVPIMIHIFAVYTTIFLFRTTCFDPNGPSSGPSCYSKCHVTSNKANSNLEWAEDQFQTRGWVQGCEKWKAASRRPE
jgi:hypothetical protein